MPVVLSWWAHSGSLGWLPVSPHSLASTQEPVGVCQPMHIVWFEHTGSGEAGG